MIARRPETMPVPEAVLRPQLSAGGRLQVSTLGFSFTPEAGGTRWPHPWKPSLSGRTLRIARGIVDGLWTPQIAGKPMTEALLELKPEVQNEKGESWAALEVEPNKDGLLDQDSRVEIVHTKEGRSVDPKVGRWHLCLILWNGQAAQQVLPIAMFNPRYERFQPEAGQGAVRHLFL